MFIIIHVHVLALHNNEGYQYEHTHRYNNIVIGEVNSSAFLVWHFVARLLTISMHTRDVARALKRGGPPFFLGQILFDVVIRMC